MTAASAPEEGRKCFLKVTYNGRIRMIEWKSNEGTFKLMDEKVRKMFGLGERIRLLYSYFEPSTSCDIVMSSDEELTTALHFMVGEIIAVNVIVDKKKKKSAVFRAYHSAQPKVKDFLVNLPATVRARMTQLCMLAITCINSFCHTFTHRNNNNTQVPRNAPSLSSSSSSPSLSSSSPPPPVHIPRRQTFGLSHKFAIFLLFLVLAIVVAKRNEYKLNQFRENISQFYHPHHSHPNHYGNHVTILAATYGGKDVTLQAREYYNRVGSMKASNDIFGDPTPRVRKYLHVVYQYYTYNGLQVFYQSFPESNANVNFDKQKETCAYPEEAIVDGSSVKILGALYDDVSATCPTRRLAATGQFSAQSRYRESAINRNHFGSHSSHGFYTVVYVKDNVLKTFVGREGSHVSW